LTETPSVSEVVCLDLARRFPFAPQVLNLIDCAQRDSEIGMIRHLLLVLSLALSTIAVAAEPTGEGHQGTPEEQQACQSDVARHCRGVQDKGDEATVDCLIKKHRPACRQVIE
jgi:hypothetical protein